MTQGFDDNYFPLQFLSISQMIGAARCLRRFFFQTGCRLGNPMGPHVALKFGEAIHAGIPYAIAEGNLQKAFDAFLKVWTGSQEDDKHNVTVAKLMLADLASTHKPGHAIYNLVQPDSSLRVGGTISDYELPFAIQIPGLEIPIYGRIDGMATHRDDKTWWGVEFKTSSEQSARLHDQFRSNVQVLTYMLALRLYMPEKNFVGMMVETILKSKTRVGSQVHPIYVPTHMLDEHIRWLSYTGNLILYCEKMKHFPQQRTGCTPYQMFGMPGFSCEYLPLCDVEDWTVLKQFFSVQPQHLPFEIPNVDVSKVKALDATNVPAALKSLPMIEEAAGTTSLTVKGEQVR